MPRAVASFRAAGLEVLAYPVDFRTEPARLHWPRDPGASLGLAGLALHEWLGLLVYYLAGHSADFFTAPRQGPACITHLLLTIDSPSPTQDRYPDTCLRAPISLGRLD